MKSIEKATIIQQVDSVENTMAERRVLEAIGRKPFLNTMHYAFQTKSELHLVLVMTFY